MKFYEIALIGAGQLGSRYLQGLAKCHIPLSIHVIDRSRKALEASLDRYNEVETCCEHRVFLATELKDLPGHLNLAIISTGADTRYEVLEKLCSTTMAEYIILEKVLFQTLMQYVSSRQLLAFMKDRVWVNCPRRLMDSYKQIRDNLPDGRISLSVSGFSWNLTCNAIHYLDLWSWLGAKWPFEWDASELDEGIIPSKREGFVEITGRVVAKSKNGDSLELISSRDFKRHFIEKIQVGTSQWTVNPQERLVKFRAGNNSIERAFTLPYQSDITNRIVENILLTGTCELTPFEESSRLHCELISVFLKHIYGAAFSEKTVCPIT